MARLEIGFANHYTTNVLEHTLVMEWLTNQSLNPTIRDRFPGGENMNLLFISNLVIKIKHHISNIKFL